MNASNHPLNNTFNIFNVSDASADRQVTHGDYRLSGTPLLNQRGGFIHVPILQNAGDVAFGVGSSQGKPRDHADASCD